MNFFEHLTPTQLNAVSTGLVVIGLLVLRGFGLRLVSRHVADLAAYPVVIWRTLLKVGDRIQISTFRGGVISVNLFYTTIAEVGGL